MTARATFPPATPQPVPGHLDARCAEARLIATALRLWQGGAAAQVDGAARLRAAFGTGPGNAVAAALDRVWTAVQDDAADDRNPDDATTDALARLVAATLHGTDAEDAARHMALGIVPAHQMETLVIAARGLALALRRAVLIASGPAHCPVQHHGIETRSHNIST